MAEESVVNAQNTPSVAISPGTESPISEPQVKNSEENHALVKPSPLNQDEEKPGIVNQKGAMSISSTSNEAAKMDKPALEAHDKRKMGPRMLISLEEVDLALTQCQGNRKAAAELLKISVDKLKNFIYDNSALRAKWSREGMNARARDAARQKIGLPVGPPARPHDKAMAMLIDIEQETSFRLNKLLTRMELTADRIDNGEKARTSEDVEFVRRHGFRWTEDGSPAEEKMLRENLVEMGKLVVQMKKEFRETLWTVHKMEFMDKKYQGGQGQGPKRAKPGFMSKAERMAVPSEVVDELMPA